jgi:hypothetical protein
LNLLREKEEKAVAETSKFFPYKPQVKQIVLTSDVNQLEPEPVLNIFTNQIHHDESQPPEPSTTNEEPKLDIPERPTSFRILEASLKPPPKPPKHPKQSKPSKILDWQKHSKSVELLHVPPAFPLLLKELKRVYKVATEIERELHAKDAV